MTTSLKTQRRMAASILKAGRTRVWIDPEMAEEVSGAMTHGDIRKYIGLGFIKAKPNVGNSRGRIRFRTSQRKKGRQRGEGTRKGARNARMQYKKIWMKQIRAIRRLLKELRNSQAITKKTYRRLYLLSKAGTFKNKANVLIYLKENKLLAKVQRKQTSKK